MNDSTARTAIKDSVLEDAIRAAETAARSFGNDPRADIAWSACLTLKALRRPEVTKRLDVERLARARA